MQDHFPCKVTVYNPQASQTAIKFSTLIRAYLVSQKRIGGEMVYWVSGSPDFIVTEAMKLSEVDHLWLARFVREYIEVFGKPERGNTYFQACPFFSAMSIAMVNSKVSNLWGRFKKIMGNSMVMERSKEANFLGLKQMRELMLDIMNGGYSKNLVE
jgi:hypothetical protein